MDLFLNKEIHITFELQNYQTIPIPGPKCAFCSFSNYKTALVSPQTILIICQN